MNINFKSKHIFVYNQNEYINILNLMKKHSNFEFFFIRYWESGPHIRIRYQGTFPKEIYDYVKKIPPIEFNKDKFLKGFFDGTLTKIDINKMNFFDQNTIHNIKYIREFERYGGVTQINLCEKNFIKSTNFAIKILNYRLSHTMLVTIWLLLIKKTIDSEISKVYIKYINKIFNMKNINSNYISNINNLSTNETVIKNFNKILNYNEWKKLSADFEYWIVKDKRILFSLLHMTANRLGISVTDEFICYNLQGKSYD